jgi:hypothetical protein
MGYVPDNYLVLGGRTGAGRVVGDERMEVASQCFRVQTTRVSTPWLPDTPLHAHLTAVW